jgi:RNA polymerase sigma-70 factor (ECF subfamily)
VGFRKHLHPRLEGAQALVADFDQHLAAIVAGDADAFGRFVAGAEPVVRDSLRAFAAAVDTEAVLQEALLRLWQAAPRFVPDGKPNGLLRFSIRIARNLALSEARRLRTAPCEDDELERALEALERREFREGPDPLLRRIIEACREKLPAKPAQALLARLSSAGAEPDAALAARLGMRLNTFLQNFTRARKLLAECLARNGVDLEAELR